MMSRWHYDLEILGGTSENPKVWLLLFVTNVLADVVGQSEALDGHGRKTSRIDVEYFLCVPVSSIQNLTPKCMYTLPRRSTTMIDSSVSGTLLP